MGQRLVSLQGKAHIDISTFAPLLDVSFDVVFFRSNLHRVRGLDIVKSIGDYLLASLVLLYQLYLQTRQCHAAIGRLLLRSTAGRRRRI